MTGRSRRDSVPSVHPGGDGRYRPKKISHTSRIRKRRPKTPAPTSSFHSSHLPQWIKHKKVTGKKKNISKSATWTIEMEEFIQGPKCRKTNATSGRGNGDSGNNSRHQRKRRGVRGKRGVAPAAYSFRVAYAVGVSDDNGALAHAAVAGSSDTTTGEPRQQQFFELVAEQWAGGGGGGGGPGIGGGGSGGGTGGRGRGGERRASTRPSAESTANDTAGYSMATLVRPMSPDSQFIISTAVFSSAAAVAAAAAAATGQTLKGSPQNKGFAQTSGSGAGDSDQYVSFVSSYCSSPNAATGAPNQLAQLLPVLVPQQPKPSTPPPNSPTTISRASLSSPAPPVSLYPSSSSSMGQPIPLPPPSPSTTSSEPVNENELGDMNSPVTQPSSPRSPETLSQSPKPPTSDPLVQETPSSIPIHGCQPRRSTPSTSPGKRRPLLPVTTTQQQQCQSPARHHSASPSLHTDKKQITIERPHASPQNSAIRLREAQNLLKFESIAPSMSFLSRLGRGYEAQPTPRLPTTLPSALPPSFSSMAHLTRRKSPQRSGPPENLLKKTVNTPQLPLDAKSLLERPVLLSNMLVRSEDSLGPVPKLTIKTNDKNMDSLITDQTYRVDYTNVVKRMKEWNEESYVVPKHKHPYHTEATQTNKSTHSPLWTEMTALRPKYTKESFKPSVNASSTPGLTNQPWSSSAKKDQMPLKEESEVYPLFQRSLSSTSLSVNASSIASKRTLSSTTLGESYSSRMKHRITENPMRKSAFVQTINKKKSRESNKMKKQSFATKLSQPSTTECEKMLDRKAVLKESENLALDKNEMPKQILNKHHINPSAETSKDVSEIIDILPPARVLKSKEVSNPPPVEEDPKCLENQNITRTNQNETQEPIGQLVESEERASESLQKTIVEEQKACSDSLKKSESAADVSQPLQLQSTSECLSLAVTVSPMTKEVQEVTSTSQFALPLCPSEHTAKISSSVTSTKSCLLIPMEIEEPSTCAMKSDTENISCTDSKDSFLSETDKKSEETNKTYILSESKTYHFITANEVTNKYSETQNTQDRTDISTSTETLKEYSGKEEKITDEKLIRDLPSKTVENEPRTYTPKIKDENVSKNTSINFPELQQIHDSLQNMTQFLSRRVEEVVSAVSLSADGSRFANHSLSLLQRSVSESVSGNKSRPLSASATLFSTRVPPPSNQEDALPMKESASFPGQVQQDHKCTPAADLETSSVMVSNMIGLLSDTISELTGIPIRMASEMIKAGSKMRRRLEAVKRPDHCADTLQERGESNVSGKREEDAEGIRNSKSAQRFIKLDTILGGKECRKSSESIEKHGKHDNTKSKNNERHRKHAGSPGKRTSHRREKQAKASKKSDCSENKGVMTDEIQAIDKDVACHGRKTMLEKETSHEVPVKAQRELTEHERERELTNKIKTKDDGSTEVPEHESGNEITNNEENSSGKLKCRYGKGEENSNMLCDSVRRSYITEDKESHENSFPLNVTVTPQNGHSTTQKLFQESATKRNSKTSECHIELAKKDESVLKHNRDGFNTEDISDPMIDFNQIMDDSDENNLIAHRNNSSIKPDQSSTKCKVDIEEELNIFQSIGEANENNFAVHPTNHKLDKSYVKCKDNFLQRLKDYDSMNHDSNERVSDNASRASSARSKDCSQKTLLLASHTKESLKKEKTMKYFSNKTPSENKKEEQICDEGPSTSIKLTHCTDVTSTPLNNITRKETHSKPSESFDGNRGKHNASKDIKNEDDSQFFFLRNDSLNTQGMAFHFPPSFDRTRDISPTNYAGKEVHYNSNALGYRVPRKRTRVERATTPITDNMTYFSISEKMKSPSSDATSDTSSSCSGRTVKEVVPKTNFNQSTNEITKQENIINVTFINKNNDETNAIKNNVTPDILLAPNKKSYNNPPLLLSTQNNPRPKSILTIPVEVVDSFRENSIVIRDQKNADTRHEYSMKHFPILSKKKRKRLEFQRIPIRMRKRPKIPDSWNPLKLNIPTSVKFNIFQTCEVAKSLSEEKSNIIIPSKTEFKFSLSHNRPTQSPRERKNKEITHEIAEGEITDNDRKMDFLIIEPPERDVESKVYGPVMFSCKERKETLGFDATDSIRCSSPIRGSTMGLNETNVQNNICESETEPITYSTKSKGRVNVTLGKNTDNVESDSKGRVRKENKYQIPSIVAASSICFSHTKCHEMKGLSSQYSCGKGEYTKTRTSSASTREELDNHIKNSPVGNEVEDNFHPVRSITISRDNIILKQTDSITLKDDTLFPVDEACCRGKTLTIEQNEKNEEGFLTSITNRKKNVPKETTLNSRFPVQPMKEFKPALTCGMNESLTKETVLNKASTKTSVNTSGNSTYKKFIRFRDRQVETPRSSLVSGQRHLEHQSTVCFSMKKESSEESLQQFTKPRQKLHSTSTHSLFSNKYPLNAKDSERNFSRQRGKEVKNKVDIDPKKTAKLGWSQAFDKYRSFQKSAQSGSARDKFLFVKSVSENSFPKYSYLDFPDPFEYSVVPSPLDIPNYLDTVTFAADDKVNEEVSKTSIHILPNKGKNENTKLVGANKQKRLASATKALFQVAKDDDRKTEIRKRRFALSPHSNHPRQWMTHLDNSSRPKFPFPKSNRREDKNIKECTWIVGGINSTTDCKVGNFGAQKNPTIRMNPIKNGSCNPSPRGLRNNTMRIKSARSNKMFQEKVISMNDTNQIETDVEMKHQECETHAFLVRVKNAYSEEPKISLEHISSSKPKCKKRADASPTAFLTAPKSTTGAALWKEVEVEARDSPVRKISVTCLPKISLTTLENTLQSGRKSSLFSLSRCERKGSGQEARGEVVASAHNPRRSSLAHLERSPPRNAPPPPASTIPSPPTPPGSPPNVANVATSISSSLIHLSRGEQKKEMDPRAGSKDRGLCRRSGVVWGRRWCKHRREGEGEGEVGNGEREGGCGVVGEGAPTRLAFCDSAGDLAGRKTPRVDQRLKEAVASRKRAWRPGSHTRRRGMDAACALRECKYLCSLAAVLDRLAAVYRETDEPAEDMELDECPTEDEVTWDSSGCGVQLRQPSSASPMLQRNSMGTLTTALGSVSHTVPVAAGTRMHQGRDRTRGNRPPAARHRSRIPVLARKQESYLPHYPNDSWCFGLSE